MSKELEKQYNPKNVEDRIYKDWLSKKYFHAKREEGKKTYTIVIPPPNITGQLHMGHALDNTLQDILIRYHRMAGYDTLWLPGTDHASIATEAKIVETMRKEGITKEEYEKINLDAQAEFIKISQNETIKNYLEAKLPIYDLEELWGEVQDMIEERRAIEGSYFY